MEKASKAILARGLLEGYIGKSSRSSVIRAGFSLETSDYKGFGVNIMMNGLLILMVAVRS